MESSSPLSRVGGSPPSSPLSSLSITPPISPTLNFPKPVLPDLSKRYLSPDSTAASMSGTQSPIKLGDPILDQDRSDDKRDDESPPTKKRRIQLPRERTTEYLDILKPEDDFSGDDKVQMERLVNALRKKKKIVVIAGAGISVSAGIPDFRSSNGLFATTKKQHNLKASGKHLFDASVYKHDSSTQSFHTMVREMVDMSKNAAATPFHHLLASLAQEGRLLRLYSQNIDCIDTSMGPLATEVPLKPKGPWPKTIQLHGGLKHMVCTKCTDLKPFDATLFDGPEPPLCQACTELDQVRTAYGGKRSHGIGRLRPRFVLYNEFNPDEDAIGKVSSADLKTRPDAVIVVGTTLKVPGTRRLVKELCQVTRGRRDGFTAWINLSSEPKGVEFKDCWDLVVRAKCDSVARLVALPPWDCDIGEDYLLSKDECLAKTNIRVTIPVYDNFKLVETDLKPMPFDEIQLIPTPQPSPKISVIGISAKTKQTKLSFTTNKAASSEKSLKPKKQGPRKSNKSVKDTDIRNKSILGTFKHFKKVTNRAVEKEHTAALPSLRSLSEANLLSTVFKYSSDAASSTITPEPPSTPTMATRRLSADTISPPSVPKSFQNLID